MNVFQAEPQFLSSQATPTRKQTFTKHNIVLLSNILIFICMKKNLFSELKIILFLNRQFQSIFNFVGDGVGDGRRVYHKKEFLELT